MALALKLKSLASKPISPQKYPVLGSRTALFFAWLKRKKPEQKTTYLTVCQFVVSFPYLKNHTMCK